MLGTGVAADKVGGSSRGPRRSHAGGSISSKAHLKFRGLSVTCAATLPTHVSSAAVGSTA
ncbi:MAG: hypothetical protein FRX49_07436 [Trebouxia sp. A1-2]|nr:MAG: hypothetical protein FRX49_07436 [Trebouxia sp. A1-2]